MSFAAALAAAEAKAAAKPPPGLAAPEPAPAQLRFGTPPSAVGAKRRLAGENAANLGGVAGDGAENTPPQAHSSLAGDGAPPATPTHAPLEVPRRSATAASPLTPLSGTQETCTERPAPYKPPIPTRRSLAERMVADEALAAAETEAALAISTNLFCGNLDPNVDEEMLCALFMPFGEVLTIKILWPPAQVGLGLPGMAPHPLSAAHNPYGAVSAPAPYRSPSRRRRSNCGFVNFARREDAATAMGALAGRSVRARAPCTRVASCAHAPRNPDGCRARPMPVSR